MSRKVHPRSTQTTSPSRRLLDRLKSDPTNRKRRQTDIITRCTTCMHTRTLFNAFRSRLSHSEEFPARRVHARCTRFGYDTNTTIARIRGQLFFVFFDVPKLTRGYAETDGFFCRARPTCPRLKSTPRAIDRRRNTRNNGLISRRGANAPPKKREKPVLHPTRAIVVNFRHRFFSRKFHIDN